jgi:UDP:flavonoid glycosyltransferase YjiC (YdhE family)
MITVDTTTNARLYWEARGNGQPVLLIAGTPGDAGQFERVAGAAGAGTVLASLTAGVPLLLLPRGAPSQLRMSTACAERGVARLVAPNDANAGTIEEALGDLMKDGRFSRNAHELAEEIAAMPGPSTVVPCLELAGRAT